MRQFDVCRLRNAGRGANATGLVLILQADLMSDLQTCVVAPLVSLEALSAIRKLRPEFEVGGKRYRLICDRLSTLERRHIGAVVGSLKPHEWDIRRALDLVFVGV
jgi:hypothetical protein